MPPVYCWECIDCKHVTEIVRPMESFNVPPEKCDSCSKTELTKIIEPVKKEQIHKVWNGSVPWHDESYNKYKPIR